MAISVLIAVSVTILGDLLGGLARELAPERGDELLLDLLKSRRNQVRHVQVITGKVRTISG